MDELYVSTTGTYIINLSEANATGTNTKKQAPAFKRIGDMVYFLDVGEAIPLREIPTDVKRKLGLI